MPEAELKELAQDIKTNGLQEPIWLYEGKILDGRNRHKACQLASIPLKTREYKDNSPVAFIVSMNLMRRQLTDSQKAAAAVEILPWLEDEAKKRQGTRTDLNLVEKFPQSKARDQAGRLFGVSGRYVSEAKALKAKRPEEFERVKEGKKTLSQATRESKHEEALRDIQALPSDKFRVIYADPPWHYENKGLDNYGHTERHYPTMTILKLCELEVKELAEDNAVLFLWVTSPLLADCWPVIKAWGFEYKSSFVWNKVKHNYGHYNSVRHEFLLVGIRGSFLPQTNKLEKSVVTIERTDVHSKKPEEFRGMIDRMYPKGRRIELFARREVPRHWEKWPR